MQWHPAAHSMQVAIELLHSSTCSVLLASGLEPTHKPCLRKTVADACQSGALWELISRDLVSRDYVIGTMSEYMIIDISHIYDMME